MAEKIKAYIFDLCNTLVYFPEGRQLKEIIGKECHEFLLAHKFSDIEISEETKKKFLELHKKAEMGLYPDTEEVLKILKARGYKLAVVSNLYDITAQRVRKQFSDFLKNFDVIAFSSELEIRKPDYRIFQHVLAQLGVKPEEAVMVGDNARRDIAPAQELGMSTILIDRSKQKLMELI